ncbi:MULTISPECIES: hypothetical protein [Streptomyces]|uniref:hypothetical protein n=1 Tax=Streptomyces TaxID=1883 RepID=UPI00130073B2|nr:MULTISPECIES: hypothetical protein [Streptomyces]
MAKNKGKDRKHPDHGRTAVPNAEQPRATTTQEGGAMGEHRTSPKKRERRFGHN